MSSTGVLASTGSGAATGASVGGPWGAVIGGAIGLGTGIAEDDAGSQLNQEALDNVQQALTNYNGVIPPEIKAILVSNLQQQGLYTPEIENALQVGPSQASQVQENPATRNAQMAALSQLSTVSNTGLRPEDRLAMLTANNQTQTDANAKLGQLTQQLQATGQNGPDAQLMMRLQASQQGANSASSQADQNNSMAAQNALSALSQYNDLAGQSRAQDFSNNAAKASAADEFNRFNVQNKQQVGNTNVQNSNQAQASNLSEAQRISNTNADNAYNESVRQQQAQQQQYQNQMAVASGKANAQNGQANVQNAQGTAQNQGTANAVGGAISSGASLLGSASKTNDNKDLDVTDEGYGGSLD